MASRQGLPRERKRDRAGADRSELHDAPPSGHPDFRAAFIDIAHKSMQIVMPNRDGRAR
jgi:hypothetical protein